MGGAWGPLCGPCGGGACGVCGLKNGLYGEKTFDSCSEGFGIATEVGNDTGNMGGGGGGALGWKAGA